MKKPIILLTVAIFFNVFSALSQEEETTNFAYRSIAISPLGMFSGGSSGVAVSATISFDYGMNIFSVTAGAGTEGAFIGRNDDFSEINLLYGRSYPLSENFFAEVFVGAGHFHYNTYGIIDSNTGRKGEISESTIGFLIGTKFQFMLGTRYSMGLKLGGNINATQSIVTLGLVLQWNRKRD
jgi:hypothetical protein